MYEPNIECPQCSGSARLRKNGTTGTAFYSCTSWQCTFTQAAGPAARVGPTDRVSFDNVSVKNAPLSAEESLRPLIDKVYGTKYWPRMFPSNPTEAIDTWIHIHEKATRVSEAPQNNGTTWICPYNTRLLDCLGKFLMMDEWQQAELYEGIKRGYHWRGEPLQQWRDTKPHVDIMLAQGHDETGRQPEPYTKAVVALATGLAVKWGSLPYNKNEAQAPEQDWPTYKPAPVDS